MAVISGAAIHPLCVDFDDDRLRSQLLHLAEAVSGSAGLKRAPTIGRVLSVHLFADQLRVGRSACPSSVFVRIPGQ